MRKFLSFYSTMETMSPITAEPIVLELIAFTFCFYGYHDNSGIY